MNAPIEKYDQIVCKECFGTWKYLGSHIARAHKMTAKAYKQKHDIDYNMPLISEEVRLRKQIAFNADREKYLAQGKLNIAAHMFRPGDKRLPKRISNQTKLRLIEQAKTARTPGICPLKECGFTHYENLPSHLYNAHRLLQVS